MIASAEIANLAAFVVSPLSAATNGSALRAKAVWCGRSVNCIAPRPGIAP
jgi:hypothetical protein